MRKPPKRSVATAGQQDNVPTRVLMKLLFSQSRYNLFDLVLSARLCRAVTTESGVKKKHNKKELDDFSYTAVLPNPEHTSLPLVGGSEHRRLFFSVFLFRHSSALCALYGIIQCPPRVSTYSRSSNKHFACALNFNIVPFSFFLRHYSVVITTDNLSALERF